MTAKTSNNSKDSDPYIISNILNNSLIKIKYSIIEPYSIN